VIWSFHTVTVLTTVAIVRLASRYRRLSSMDRASMGTFPTGLPLASTLFLAAGFGLTLALVQQAILRSASLPGLAFVVPIAVAGAVGLEHARRLLPARPFRAPTA
jgi:hypothetical protein